MLHKHHLSRAMKVGRFNRQKTEIDRHQAFETRPGSQQFKEIPHASH